jgi:hypothetical protein
MKTFDLLFYILTKSENGTEVVITKGDFETCRDELNKVAGFKVMKNPATVDGATFTIYESHLFEIKNVIASDPMEG